MKQLKIFTNIESDDYVTTSNTFESEKASQLALVLIGKAEEFKQTYNLFMIESRMVEALKCLKKHDDKELYTSNKTLIDSILKTDELITLLYACNLKETDYLTGVIEKLIILLVNKSEEVASYIMDNVFIKGAVEYRN